MSTSAPEQIPAVVPSSVMATNLEELAEHVSSAGEDGLGLSLRDASDRFWIVDADEHGDPWATSFPREDDTLTLPCAFGNAPISFPVIVFTLSTISST